MKISAAHSTQFPGANVLPAYDIGVLREWEFLYGGMFLKPVLIATSTGRYVLRAHRFRTTAEKFRFQAETLEYLARAGIHCPQVIWTRDGSPGKVYGGAFWALHEYLEGDIYSWSDWSKHKSDPRFLEHLGAGIAKLHDALSQAAPGGDANFSASVPPIQFHLLACIWQQWHRDLDALLCGSVSAGRSCDALAACRGEIDRYWDKLAEAVEALDIAGLPRQIVHGDISPVNLVFDRRGEFSLIDWDCLHVGLRMYDALGDVLNRVPREMALSAEFHVEEVRTYLHGYQACTERELTAQELACVPAFCLARQLEDLRQRVSVLPALPERSDEEYAVLIRGRVQMMRSICERTRELSKPLE